VHCVKISRNGSRDVYYICVPETGLGRSTRTSRPERSSAEFFFFFFAPFCRLFRFSGAGDVVDDFSAELLIWLPVARLFLELLGSPGRPRSVISGRGLPFLHERRASLRREVKGGERNRHRRVPAEGMSSSFSITLKMSRPAETRYCGIRAASKPQPMVKIQGLVSMPACVMRLEAPRSGRLEVGAEKKRALNSL